jgi:hypothetical protein
MSTFFQPRDLGLARTLIAVAGLALLSAALWFPRESLLSGAGVLLAMTVLVGVRNSDSTVATAVLSLLASACCITGGFLVSYHKTLSQIVSLVGVALVVWLGVFHFRSYLRRRERRRGGQGLTAVL